MQYALDFGGIDKKVLDNYLISRMTGNILIIEQDVILFIINIILDVFKIRKF